MASKQVVGWQVGAATPEELITTALQRAFWAQPPTPGLFVHADRGGQYGGNAYRQLLRDHKAVGLSKAQCVRCFFLMQRSLEARKADYLHQYGHYPPFKAGLHGGRVVVTWVGEVKRKIVYHGDVLNTTARIQSLCNELGQQLLISQDLLAQLPPLSDIEATYLSTLQLRGRPQAVGLYGLTYAPRPVTASLTETLPARARSGG